LCTRPSRPRIRAWLVASALAVTLARPSPARADRTTDQAKTYFNAGAQAYAAGQFVAAVQAFEEAYRLIPKPAIVFSMAQALRRQYFIDKKPENLRAAIQRYRAYVDEVSQGGRRADAAQALAELEPIAARLPVDASGSATSAVASKAKTRLMVSSQTEGATVQLDDGKPGEMPLIGEVSPGKHRLKVMAEGYFDDEREVLALEGGIVAVDVSLRERPAKLDLTGTTGADVTVDGRLLATTPLSAPIELAAGTHLVTVARTGAKPFSEELTLARAETKKLDVSLASTGQRKASYVLMLTGAVGVVGGAVCVGLAVQQQQVAQGLLDQREKENLSKENLDAYDKARANRDGLKNAAGWAFGAGVAVGVTGLLLYAFDRPSVAPPALRRRDDAPKPAPKDAPSMELSAAPMWAPGLAGGTLLGRF
jgi:hypothetical protein